MQIFFPHYQGHLRSYLPAQNASNRPRPANITNPWQGFLLRTLFWAVSFLAPNVFEAQTISAIGVGNMSACNGANTSCSTDDTYTADVTVTYDYLPASGNLTLGGASIVGTPPSIAVGGAGTTSYTFLGVTLLSNGAAIELSATFDGLPAFVNSNAGTAPVQCSGNTPSAIAMSNTYFNSWDETYVFAGYFNDAPYFSAYNGDIRWTGTEWELWANNGFGVVTANNTGSSSMVPCSGWSDNFGFLGGPSVSGGCDVPFPPQLCNVLNIYPSDITDCHTNGTGTAADDYITADLTVLFEYAPSTGYLTVKSNGVVVASIPAADLACVTEWTFDDAHIPADGLSVVLSAEFSPTCRYDYCVLGLAPAPCPYPEITAIVTGNLSGCNGANTSCTEDDTYTADVTVYYDYLPTNVSLNLGGASIVGTPPYIFVDNAGATSHTFEGVTLLANSSAIELSAAFDGLPEFVNSNAGIAPSQCSANTPTDFIVSDLCRFNGTYSYVDQYNGASRYICAGEELRWAGDHWQFVYTFTGSEDAYASGASSSVPLTGWHSTSSYHNADCLTFSLTANYPPFPCTISDITIGDVSACNNNGTLTGTDDTFTADITIAFDFAPLTGDLTLKHGTTVLATKNAADLACVTQWTFDNVPMLSDGAFIDVTAEFDGCSYSNSFGTLGMAPEPCSTPQIISVATSNISGCNGANTTCTTDDTYTANVTLTYDFLPLGGSITVDGASIVGSHLSEDVDNMGATSFTFTGVTLSSNGAPIELSAWFDGLPAFDNSNAGTAPSSCSNSEPLGFNVSGSGQSGAANGAYSFSGYENGAPFFYNSTKGTTIKWTGEEWWMYLEEGEDGLELYHVHTTGTADMVPCSGWADNGFAGNPTLDNGCDEAFPTPCSVNGIALANMGTCQDNASGIGSDDFFTTDVIVDLALAPSMGYLTLLSGNTVLATKSAADLACLTQWTFPNISLPSNGANIVLTAEFSNGCTFTSGSLGTAPTPCSDNDGDGFVGTADCDDNNPAIYPGATETCNSVDDDCDGAVDENVLTDYYADNDGDTYGDATGVPIQACAPPMGYTTSHTDCDDAHTSTYPGATELCGNAIDDDCDGSVDEPSFTIDRPNYVKNVSCYGGNDGYARVNASVFATAQIGEYTFLWNNGSHFRTDSVSAGTYTVTVTKVADGCSQVQSGFVVTQPDFPLTVTEHPASHKNVSCYGGSNGQTQVVVTHNFGVIKYTWSNGATTKLVTGLSAGTYTVTVVDGRNCSATGTYIITEPPAIGITTTQGNVICYGYNIGSIGLAISNTTGLVTYLWNDGVTTKQRSGLATGTYTVTVTNGTCAATKSIAINGPSAPIVVSELLNTHKNVKCYGESTGIIKTSAVNSVGPKTYAWNNGATTANLASIPAGIYTVTVTDVRGCTGILASTITEPAALTLGLTSVAPMTGGYRVIVAGVGGTGTLRYRRDPAANFVNPPVWVLSSTFTKVPIGNYTFFVKDANACVTSLSVTVPTPFSEYTDDRGEATIAENSLLLYPSPTSDVLNVALANGIALDGDLIVTDVLGRVVLRKNIQLLGGDILQIGLEHWNSGTYSLQYAGKDGVLLNTRFVVER